jgi:hypothetical protein
MAVVGLLRPTYNTTIPVSSKLGLRQGRHTGERPLFPKAVIQIVKSGKSERLL